MYPSIKFGMVKRAINFFASKAKLAKEERKTIRDCLDLINFGISSTMITFQDRYYECGGNEEEEDKGLMIGGYEPAWLADLVAAYILDNTEARFRGTTYRGIYRDEASRGVLMASIHPLILLHGNAQCARSRHFRTYGKNEIQRTHQQPTRPPDDSTQRAIDQAIYKILGCSI
mmetsp:Transcript_5125/g.11175  ORF Transcript_5125/g.11175 Transcript_5125/m.11175 type:complete len:173 (+) Transcript_5125:426-944(+)